MCDDNWTDNKLNAKVVCRQLGYSDALEILNTSYVTSGRDVINLDDVDCRGTENTLLECIHVSGADVDCDHTEDVGIKCKTGLHNIWFI